jgi:fructose-1,6-bisphosphatase I
LNISLVNWLELRTPETVHKAELIDTIAALTEAGRILSGIIAQGDLVKHATVQTGTNADGDGQKELDVLANDLVIDQLSGKAVKWLASEELEDAMLLSPQGTLALTIDPLDGSSNVDTNLTLGTIFSIYPGKQKAADALLQPGRQQLAAGFMAFGPQTSLILTLGKGTFLFTLDRARRQFFLVREDIRIPQTTQEFAINASNYRHWQEPFKDYVEGCLDGDTGPRGKNFNKRWLASLVAECQRIMSRGGIFLYPGDKRPGYQNGRLRLVYEANAIALLVEQAGGRASTGLEPILDIQPVDIHERVPLMFGSSDEVRQVENHCLRNQACKPRSPLFGNRGLFVN